MHASGLLALGSELLREVLRFDRAADAVVADFGRRHPALGARDRLVLADTAYAVLRRLPLLRHLTQAGPGTIERRLVLLAWAGDAAALHAALSSAEGEWLAAVRRVDLESLPAALRHNLPDWLAEPWQAELGADEFWRLVESLERPAPLDLRVNTAKSRREAAQAWLAAAGIVARPTPYSPSGLRLQGKPALQRLDLYRSGAVEVQDEGSQLLALLTGARRGETVVDFCAGAGGKTLALGALMRDTGHLYAVDVSGHRLAALKPRLARSALSNVYTLQVAHERDPRLDRLAGKAHRVLVDAPCSGTGTLRRHPDLKWRQSAAAVRAMAERQAAVLDGAARLVAPGGRIVYATCSLLAEENEQQALAFGARHPDFEPLAAATVLERLGVADAASLAPSGHLRLWPHRHHTDGFFAALWQRRR
jgi:16S rRNA (cytosine967-C5)-methyltransferase